MVIRQFLPRDTGEGFLTHPAVAPEIGPGTGAVGSQRLEALLPHILVDIVLGVEAEVLEVLGHFGHHDDGPGALASDEQSGQQIVQPVVRAGHALDIETPGQSAVAALLEGAVDARHPELAAAGAGKHVYIEKPLALRSGGLDARVYRIDPPATVDRR